MTHSADNDLNRVGTARSMNMSLKRVCKSHRGSIVVAAGAVAASLALATPAFSSAPAITSLGSHLVSHGQVFAANRNAKRVIDVEHTPGPVRFELAAAGSGLTPVSAEVRPGTHVDQDAPLRSGGSIRSDIARYNEERSSPRNAGRQGDDSRAPANTTYRN
jgi:hypothetical protein